jgi:hypothetical protein
MNVLANTYTSEINYPVKYTNLPSQKVQIGNLPEKLSLKVNAQGFNLIRFKLTSRYLPLTFNLNAFTIYRLPGKDSTEFFLQTEYTRDYIRSQLSSDFEILSIKPDTLYFQFALVKSKYVPVVPAFNYRLGKQMILRDLPEIRPDSVLVSGPDFIIDSLPGLKTLETDLGLISNSKEYTVKMEPQKSLLIKPEKVQVGINIEQSTEKTILVPVQSENLPENFNLRTFPSKIQLNCQVGLSNYEKLQPDFFKVSVDYNEILNSETGKLKVEIVRQPDFVTAVTFSPKTVEYLIEK